MKEKTAEEVGYWYYTTIYKCPKCNRVMAISRERRLDKKPEIRALRETVRDRVCVLHKN